MRGDARDRGSAARDRGSAARDRGSAARDRGSAYARDRGSADACDDVRVQNGVQKRMVGRNAELAEAAKAFPTCRMAEAAKVVPTHRMAEAAKVVPTHRMAEGAKAFPTYRIAEAEKRMVGAFPRASHGCDGGVRPDNDEERLHAQGDDDELCGSECAGGRYGKGGRGHVRRGDGAQNAL